MSKDLILAIDQGTTNTKAIVIDRDGEILARASVPMEIAFPHPAWVEQDPLTIWLSVQTVIDSCIGQIAPEKPGAIGISNQRETVLVWDRSNGRPLGPAVNWQCRRTADFCQQLRDRHLEAFLRDRTGLTIDPLFSGSKARWLLKEIEARKGSISSDQICLGTVDSWILWNLTSGGTHGTDASNAARTQLLHLRTGVWDEDLSPFFEVPPAVLPRIHPSSEIVAETAAIGRLAAGIPIASLIGDSHAALFGQSGF